MAENPVPFTYANQVGFNLEDVILNTNNEVVLLYPQHSNKEVFLCVSDFIYKCCIRKAFTRSPVQYKEYLSEFWYSAKALDNSKVSFSTPTGGKTGGFDQITDKDAIILYCLANGVNIDYAMIFWEDIINKLKKKNREKFVLYTRFLSLLMMQKMKDGYGDGDITIHPTQIFSVNNWALKPNHTEGPPFTAYMLSIYNAEKPFAFKASVIIHFESALGYDASINSIAKADPGTSAPNDSLPPQQGKDEGTKNYSLDHIFAGTDLNVLADKTKYVSDGLETILTTPKTGTQNAEKPSEEIKLEDLAKLVPNVKDDFKDLDSPEDDPIIVVDDSEEDEEENKNEEIHSTINDKTEDSSASIPPSPKKLRRQKPKQNLLDRKLNIPLPISLPTKLKELPSKFNEVTDEVKALKRQVHGLEIEVPGDLKELPTKLEEFTTTVTSLISQVAELKSLQWELPAEFLSVPNQVASVQAKLKTLDALPSLLLKSSRIKKAKKFEFVTEDGKYIHLTKEQINQQKEIEEETKAKAARREGEIRKEELIDLLGLEVVNKYYNDKLRYDRYYDKMLSRIAKSRITNCDILTRKGPITLKVYREDDTSEIILEFKASNLHLGEWREVVTTYTNKKRPLSKQDPLDRLNDLANKKRKHADDIHDFFRANKRLKSSVQYEDHPAGTVLNEPVLETKEDLSKSFSPAWLIISSWTMSISLTEAEIKCFTSRRFKRREKDMLYVKKNKAYLLGKVTSKVGIEVQQLFLKTVPKRDIESKEPPLPINSKCIEELSYLLNKLNRTAKAEASVLVK
ncbi:hypothetical protein Tco_0250776 [Tanacetum coccineum]